ncbi:motility protein A [Pararhodospirillum photometricum]|uniref:MotA/TolQ/ExbB proton channel n=1 Tax=Pararhodospirillum photometricum DSM 122 TaxID=1150469 RepID=H6SIK1_PARPM|nr:MotA/TolQ/ExbB proton channel family protein [Pararhodospirillum photometricum]CCG06628.1 MotA/TolQ/ExbB proton channel [Pararhodospirillum photometricum DSM 122]
MSLATILGVLSGFGLFILSVVLATNNYATFLDLPSFIMVLGGTFAATFVSYEPRYVFSALKVIGSILFRSEISRGILTHEVGRIIRWGYVIQKNGMPGLESDAGKVRRQDSFLAFGIDLVISGYSGQEVREILANTVESNFQRQTVPVAILRNMGATAPAFGMIGTLVGLIIMLDHMGQDPSSMGPGLAVALVTTLYGVLAQRLIFLPAASKIRQREEIIRFRNYLVAEGLALLAERKSPRYIQDRMNSYLDPAIHFSIDRMRGREARNEE